jgi:hypothetical protein
MSYTLTIEAERHVQHGREKPGRQGEASEKQVGPQKSALKHILTF